MSYKQIRIAEVSRHQETKKRTKIVDSKRRLEPGKFSNNSFRKANCLLVQSLLQDWTIRFEVSQNRPGRSHRQWMLAKSAGEECLVCSWVRIVAIAPHSTINCVHEARFTCYDTDGHPTTHDFAIGGQVSFHSEPRLRSTRMNAKPGDHLVEDQRRPLVSRQPPQFMEKFTRLHLRTTALHRLDQHSGELRHSRFKKRQ